MIKSFNKPKCSKNIKIVLFLIFRELKFSKKKKCNVCVRLLKVHKLPIFSPVCHEVLQKIYQPVLILEQDLLDFEGFVRIGCEDFKDVEGVKLDGA